MSISTTIAAMERTGADPATILEVVKALVAEQEAADAERRDEQRAQARLRKAKQRIRERNANENVTHVTRDIEPPTEIIEETSRVTPVTQRDTPPVPPLTPPDPQTPPPISPPLRSSICPRWREMSLEDRSAMVDRVIEACGDGMADPSKHPGVTQSLLARLPAWLERWDLEADILPTVKARTAKPRSSPLRTFDLIETDIASHHNRRTRPLPNPETHDEEARSCPPRRNTGPAGRRFSVVGAVLDEMDRIGVASDGR